MVYLLYSFRIAGRCTMGYNGAHSWKKMFKSRSDTKRGRILDGVMSSCLRAFSDGGESKTSARAVVVDLPLLSRRAENASVHGEVSEKKTHTHKRLMEEDGLFEAYL